jgi:predicted cupin superfamily sugar epimerase
VIIHEDGRVETFVVGQDIAKGERLQWIVEGGKFKASFLLEDREGTGESEGLLISETVVPGFEYFDHDFLVKKSLVELVGEEKARELGWLVHD